MLIPNDDDHHHHIGAADKWLRKDRENCHMMIRTEQILFKREFLVEKAMVVADRIQ